VTLPCFRRAVPHPSPAPFQTTLAEKRCREAGCSVPSAELSEAPSACDSPGETDVGSSGPAIGSPFEVVNLDLRIPVLLVLAAAVSCATSPEPPPGARVYERNARAIVEGRVLDAASLPVAGIGVRAVPRSAEVPWAPWTETDADGRFHLVVYAPASYAFLLRRGSRSIVTSDPRDPVRLVVEVAPGESRGGVDLVFLEAEWERVRGEAATPAR
jgi:hypothetical protein